MILGKLSNKVNLKKYTYIDPHGKGKQTRSPEGGKMIAWAWRKKGAWEKKRKGESEG